MKVKRYFIPAILLAVVIANPVTAFAAFNWMNVYGQSCNDSPEECDATRDTTFGAGYGSACVPNAPLDTSPLGRQVPGSRCGNCNNKGSVCPSRQTCDSASGFCFDVTNVRACQQACAGLFMVCSNGKCVDPNRPTPSSQPQSPVSGGFGGSPVLGGGNVNSGPVLGTGNVDDTGGGSLVNPLNNISSLPELLRAILAGVVEIGAIFLTLMIVYVGFLFVAARGNEEKISSARSALLWTVIGGLILLGAQAIELVIESTVKTL